jgi:hypothetical protein
LYQWQKCRVHQFWRYQKWTHHSRTLNGGIRLLQSMMNFRAWNSHSNEKFHDIVLSCCTSVFSIIIFNNNDDN